MAHALERRQRLLKCLEFPQIDARRTTIRAAHTKTCRWLLQHSKYQDWLDPGKQSQNHGFLWMRGKAQPFDRYARDSRFGTARRAPVVRQPDDHEQQPRISRPNGFKLFRQVLEQMIFVGLCNGNLRNLRVLTALCLSRSAS